MHVSYLDVCHCERHEWYVANIESLRIWLQIREGNGKEFGTLRRDYGIWAESSSGGHLGGIVIVVVMSNMTHETKLY